MVPQARRLNEISDGLSYTLAISEAGTNGSGSSRYDPGSSNQPQWIGSAQGADWRVVLRRARHDRMPNTSTEGFSSGHPGGVHCLAGDGAVHWMSDKVDPLVWTSVNTIKRLTTTDAALNTIAAADNPPVWKAGTTSGQWIEVQSEWK